MRNKQPETLYYILTLIRSLMPSLKVIVNDSARTINGSGINNSEC